MIVFCYFISDNWGEIDPDDSLEDVYFESDPQPTLGYASFVLFFIYTILGYLNNSIFRSMAHEITHNISQCYLTHCIAHAHIMRCAIPKDI